jgi:threonine dehydrogenase-like Zn-dependent dehydrogenase
MPEGMSYEYGALVEPFAVAYRAVSQALPLKGQHAHGHRLRTRSD